MGRFFSDTVEIALRNIYYQMWTGQGQQAFQSLEHASEAGDGDASCLLARCYCGSQYVWRGHHFPENDRMASQLLHRSVEQGSAIGVMTALRSGELSPALQNKMSFGSLQEAFDLVLDMGRRTLLSVHHRQCLLLVGFPPHPEEKQTGLFQPGRFPVLSSGKHLKM